VAARTARAWLLVPAVLAFVVALLPVGARGGSALASLSVGATVVRGDGKARQPVPARPVAAPARTGEAPAGRVPPPGSLRLVGVGGARSTAGAP